MGHFVYIFTLTVLNLLAQCKGTLLLIRNQRSISLIGIDESGDTSPNVTILVPNVEEEHSVYLAVDARKKVGYFTLRNHLYSVDFETKKTTTDLGRIGLGMEDSPTAIAFDWVTRKMYIALSGAFNENTARIQVCTLTDVTNCSVLIHDNLEYLRSLVLDPIDGNMYWINGISNQIERSFMNGQHHDEHPFDHSIFTPIVKSSTLSSLILHSSSRRLYFLRSIKSKSQIWTCELYRRNSCVQILESDPIIYLSTSEEYLIWSMYPNGHIKTCRIHDCINTQFTLRNINGSELFVGADAYLQPAGKNPCAVNNGGCSHFCLLVQFEPWSRCSCPIGTPLLDDRMTCDPKGVDKVLFVAAAIGGLYQISLDTHDFSPRPILYSGVDMESTHKIYDLDYNPVEEKIYWIDGTTRYLRRCFLNGTATENVLAISNSTTSFRIDYFSNNIYTIDTRLKRISVFNLETRAARLLIHLPRGSLKGLTLDLPNRLVYFSELNITGSSIQRMKLDGSDRQTIVSTESESAVVGLFIDSKEGRMYWTESNSSFVKSSDLSGQNIKTVTLKTSRLTHPYSITKIGNNIWSNTLSGRVLMNLFLGDKQNEQKATVIESSIYGIIGLKAASLHHKAERLGPCSVNHQCDHICIAKSLNESTCMCASGYELSADGKICTKPSNFIILNQKFDTDLSSLSRISIDQPMNLQLLGYADIYIPPTAMDINQKTKMLYIADAEMGSIKKIAFNATIPETIVSDKGLQGLSAISVDWISGNLYWSNSKRNHIEVCSDNGLYRRILAWKNIFPRQLVVHPLLRSVIFVNSDKSVSIKKMSMSGHPSGGDVIVDGLFKVESMVIDMKTNRIYWVESHENNHKLSMCNIQGTSMEILFAGTEPQPKLIYPFDFNLYFTDVRGNTIGIYNGNNISTLHEGISNVTHLQIMHGDYPLGSNECASDKVCPQLCIAKRVAPEGISPYLKTDSCTCSDHHTFHAGSCNAPDNLIMIGSLDVFYQINLRRLPDKQMSYEEDPIISIHALGIGNPVSLSFDTQSKVLFWIDELESTHIKYMDMQTYIREVELSSARHNCTKFFAIDVDELGRQLFASCEAASREAYVVAFKINENARPRLSFIGVVISGKELSHAPSHFPEPRHIAVFPSLNFLFYVDVSASLITPTIVQCDLNGRRCRTWFAKDLWPMTKLHADVNHLRLFYTCPSGVWSRDVGLANENVRHFHHSMNASEYALAPIDEDNVLVAEMSSGLVSRVIDIPSGNVVETPGPILAMQRFSAISATQAEFCKRAGCSHMCRYLRDSKKRFECMCPIGYALSNDNPTVCMKNVQCSTWEFACDDGQSCVHSAKKCDRVADCRDGSDEAHSLCLNIGPGIWPCDDGTSSIDRTLLCNGLADCDDGSDERHCRCQSPRDQFDCGAWPLANSSECIQRKMMCDTMYDCENRLDEDPKVCEGLTVLSDSSKNSPEWLYLSLLGVILFLTAVLLIFCCFRHPCSSNDTSTQFTVNHTTEASILVPQNVNPSQFEVALRTYSVVESSSSYPPLPPPNGSVSRASSNSRLFTNVDIPLNKFYAPPPSAASLSTYGVVKPANAFPNAASLNRQRPKRKKSSPPPSYSQLEPPNAYDSMRSIGPVMASTPMKLTPLSCRRTPYSTHSKTPTRCSNVQNTSRLASSGSSSEHQRLRQSSSTSSLSSHSSEEGLRRT